MILRIGPSFGGAAALKREWIGLVALIAVGVGLRLAFLAVYPTLPFWDSRALVHFASLIRSMAWRPKAGTGRSSILACP
jgi:hypothetical protein